MVANKVTTEWVGAIHMHSRYSDGLGKVDTIRNTAKRLGLDFCVLTDHDTLEARTAGYEGYDGELLFLVGSEITCADNSHYLGLGIDEALPPGLKPQAVIDQVRKQRGFGVLAHPFDRGSRALKTGYPWKDWGVQGYDAMELWTWLVDWSENTHTVFHLLAGYIFPQWFIDGPNPAAYKRWAEINSHRFLAGEPPLPIVGSIDAHGFFAYRRSLRTVHTHVWAPPKTGDADADTRALFAALRSRRAFIANNILHAASGFQFTVEGAHAAYPQSCADITAPAHVTVQAPKAGEIRIYAGEELVQSLYGTHATYHATAPGTYRCEVWLKRRGRMHPWIFSNAVHLR